MTPSETGERKVVKLGHISGVHGIKGWIKIHSMTEPREAIFDYQPWMVGESRKTLRIKEGKKQGKYMVVLLEDILDRDQAESLRGQEIAVYRDQFSDLSDTEYYWTDLIGLKVSLVDGTELGTIADMLATGANDVMVVRGDKELLVPFVVGTYVTAVDLDQGLVTVDWDPDF